MDREVNLLGKLAFAMLLLAAAISVGFGIFTIVRNSSAEIVEVINEKENVKPSPVNYKDFDNVRVTGNDVKTAIYKYSTSDLAIMIATTPMLDLCDSKLNRTYLKGVYEVYIDNQPARGTMPYAWVYKSQAASYTGTITKSRSYPMYMSNGQQVSYAKIMNYGIMYGGMYGDNLGIGSTERYVNGQLYYAPRIYYDGMQRRFVCEANVLTNAVGQTVRNDNYVNFNNSDRTEYIAPNGVFESFLLMSPYDEVIGLVFIQIPNI